MMTTKLLRRLLMCGVAVAGLGLAVPAFAQNRTFDLPAQSAVKSIPQFAQQAGIQIMAPADALAGIRTPALKGSLERQQALKQLLKGTRLVVASDDGHTVVLKVGEVTPAPAKVAPASVPATELVDDVATEVVVTGFRSSLGRAQDIKRRAVGTQDSIVADDIAAFPDLNLAESLQRVAGVAITRDAGEGRQISLRGLGPDFTRTQLNGMEVLGNTSSGFDNRGSVSRTRSFDYSLFASELFNRVTVEKSYAAEQDEGGIGGTIGLRTARPFDYRGFKAVVSAKAQSNSNTDTVTPRIVGLISNRWSTSAGEFGALLSVASSENDVNEYGYRNWNWTKINVNAANIGSGVSAADALRLSTATGMDRISAPQAATYSTWYDHRKRLGITGALQYRPNDRVEMSLDLLYGKLSNDRNEYSMTNAGVNALTGDVKGTQKLQEAVIQGDTLVYAKWTGVDTRSEAKHSYDETTFTQAVYTASYQVTDALSFKGLLGYSKSEFVEPIFDKVFLQSVNRGVSYDFRSGNPGKNTYDFDITNAANWGLMRADAREDYIMSEYKTAKIDGRYDFSPAHTVKFGIEYKDFGNEGWQRYQRVDWYNKPVVPKAVTKVFDYKTLAPYVVADVDATFAATGQLRDLTGANDQAGTNFQLSEKTTSAYVQYDLDTTVSGMALRANAGVRYYSTDLTSAGTLATNNGLVPAVIKSHYDGILPALNIALNLTPDMIVRLGANRNISRPSLGDLKAAGSVSFTPFGGSVSAGNPNLHPFLADSIEASWEYYMGRKGYVSLGVFHKKMDSFITSETASVPYGSTGYPLSLVGPGQDANTIYSFSRPVNGAGATIQGAELAVQRDFDFLPAPFDKLGFTGNVTYATGETDAKVDGVTYTFDLSNLSKWSSNATIYYETATWGARISSAYRSGYLDGIGGNGNIGSGFQATNNVDFAAHYNVTSALKIVVEGLNLTNEPIDQYTDRYSQRSTSYTKSGRTFTLGATYEF
ncbi:TonB-dependent receptor [Asticcacaulis sp. 201]|uniref:TonB-dependent receptor n=1 Tax=Asticcacaulis sp. 201 TaxID=3028787 RepID=UPI0029167329|nr:TonB-dependent receptor [Asticcacaulis sp. 201]MDV6330763.1 TonB-dependent receptor [Asticcacaulis sp. 201]